MLDLINNWFGYCCLGQSWGASFSRDTLWYQFCAGSVKANVCCKQSNVAQRRGSALLHQQQVSFTLELLHLFIS